MAIPRVEQYMTRIPLTIEHTEPLEEAHRLMREYSIRHLPVVDHGRLVGIVSLGDLHLLETLKDVDQFVPVADAMTDDPVTVAPDEPLDQVAARMAAHKLGSAVVVEDGQVTGIFTNIDALTALLHVWKKAP